MQNLPEFESWLKEFRQTGQPPSWAGVLFQPTQEMTDDELHEIWQKTAPIRRKYGLRRLLKTTGNVVTAKTRP